MSALIDVVDDLRRAQGWDHKIYMIEQNDETPLQLNRVSLIQELILLIDR